MKKKVLIVTKDIAEFNNYRGIAKELYAKGFGVIVIPEGLSMQKWHEWHETQKQKTGSMARFALWGPPTMKACDGSMPYDPSSLMRYDIIPNVIFSLIAPDIVLTGLASPINLGKEFGDAANTLGIPLGFVESLWGVHTRSTAKPNFICTVDNYGVSLVEKYYNGTVQSFATGAPADDALLSVEPHPEVEAAVKKTPYTVLVAGQDHSTTPLLAGLIAALEEIGNYTIIPRFHPKWLAVTEETIARETDPEKKKTAEGIFAACNQWRAMLDGVKNGSVWWAPPHITTHQIMKTVPYTASIYSNVLREAGILGSIPVSWTSNIGRDMMRKHLGGLEQYPLVRYGAVIEVETPQEFLRRVPQPGTSRYRAARGIIGRQLRCDGKNTERVVRVIERYL